MLLPLLLLLSSLHAYAITVTTLVIGVAADATPTTIIITASTRTVTTAATTIDTLAAM